MKTLPQNVSISRSPLERPDRVGKAENDGSTRPAPEGPIYTVPRQGLVARSLSGRVPIPRVSQGDTL